jgi:hypothetical protein
LGEQLGNEGYHVPGSTWNVGVGAGLAVAQPLA